MFCFSDVCGGGDEEFGFDDRENSPHSAADLFDPLFQRDFAAGGDGSGGNVRYLGVDSDNNPVLERDDVEYSPSPSVLVGGGDGGVGGSEDAVPVDDPAVPVDDPDDPGVASDSVPVFDPDLVDDPDEAARDSVAIDHDPSRLGSQHDEVDRYVTGRVLQPNSSLHRTLNFSVHWHKPTVRTLNYHLPGESQVVVRGADLRSRQDNAGERSALLAFFDLCRSGDELAKGLTYLDLPKYYVLVNRRWERRKQGTKVDVGADRPVVESRVIGRMRYCDPRQRELFSLRVLLLKIRGPEGFGDLKTFGGHEYETFHESCLLRGFLHSDLQWIATMDEAVIYCRNASAIRYTLAIILCNCDPANPQRLWDDYRRRLSSDVFATRIWQRELNGGGPDVEIDDPTIFSEALCYLDDVVRRMTGHGVERFGLTRPQRQEPDLYGPSVQRQRYGPAAQRLLAVEAERVMGLLNAKQRQCVDRVLVDVFDDDQRTVPRVHMVQAPAGTGKSFMLNGLLDAVRGRGYIAIGVASSGKLSVFGLVVLFDSNLRAGSGGELLRRS